MGREPSLSLATGLERTTETTAVKRAQRTDGFMLYARVSDPCSGNEQAGACMSDLLYVLSEFDIGAAAAREFRHGARLC